MPCAPCWAIAWLPLAWLPGHVGAVLWAALTVVWLVLAYWAASRLCQGAALHVPPWTSVVIVLLLVRPITAEFLNGQVDLLWGLLVTASLMRANSQRTWWSAVWLALAIALKLPALIFLAFLEYDVMFISEPVPERKRECARVQEGCARWRARGN